MGVQQHEQDDWDKGRGGQHHVGYPLVQVLLRVIESNREIDIKTK